MNTALSRFQQLILTPIKKRFSQLTPSVLLQTRKPLKINILYQVSSGHLFAQLSPQTVIPFQQLPICLFKSFSTSTYSSTADKGIGDKLGGIIKKAADASKAATAEDVKDLLGELEKAAYKLMHVELKPDDKSALAALWKQVTEGPWKEGNEPKAKEGQAFDEPSLWKAWKNLGNMTKEEAAQKYLDIAKKYF